MPAIDFAGNRDGGADFLAKSNEGFRRIGGHDSLLVRVHERRLGCGQECFQHRLVFARSSLTRWRNRMGEERLQALLQESLSVAVRTKAIKPSEFSRVIVDTMVQPKNVMFPTDAKLLNRAREKLVRLAQLTGVGLRQSYARV